MRNWILATTCLLIPLVGHADYITAYGDYPEEAYIGENDSEEGDSSCCQCTDRCRPFLEDVYSDNCWDAVIEPSDLTFARQTGISGMWLPEAPLIFKPFVADPRQVCYSVGWRFNDQILVKNVIDVSYGDTLGIYRWFNIFGGQMQLDIEGALWAVFDPLHESSPLIDADYYVGFPITYGKGDWSFRLRGYHISTHIGDEFLLNHPHFKRKNPSAEFFDFAVSNQFTRDIRLYGVLGVVAAQDESFRCSRWYCAAGAELRLSELGYRDYCDRLYGEPFLGMHWRYQPDFKKHIDMTYVLGYEWGKYSGIRRKVRIYLEYHDGYSVDGQFCKYATNYFSIRTSYGY